MGKLKTRMKKIAGHVGPYNLKVLCVQTLLEEENITLVDMDASDVVDYIERYDEITFGNIEDLLEDWIEETRENHPELIR